MYCSEMQHILIPNRRATVTEALDILEIHQEEGYGLIVTFSDGTYAKYTIEELLELRPYRESSASKDQLKS